MTERQRPTILGRFTEQFTARDSDGQASGVDPGYVYRDRHSGNAYAVTAHERDMMIAAFRTVYYRAMIGTALLVLAMVGAIWLIAAYRTVPAPVAALAAMASVALPFALTAHRLRSAPERWLAQHHRRQLGPALAEQDRAAIEAREIPWVQLLIPPLIGVIFVSAIGYGTDVTQGWGRTAWLVPIALTVLAVVQARRKIRPTR